MSRFSPICALAFVASAFVVPLGAPATTIKGPSLAQFRPWPASDTSTIRYIPTFEQARKLPPCSGSKCDLQYRGGPVLTTPHAYVIFWDFERKNKGIADPDGIEKLMREYFGNFGGTAYANIVTQYFEITGSTKTFISNPTDQSSFWDDVQDRIPAHPSDAQIQQEALNGVAHFGYDASGTYIVISAYKHDPVGFGPPGWCTIHGAFNSSYGVVSYTNLPYMPDAGKYCGANFISPPPDELGVDEGQTIVAGAIYEAAVTDPQPVSGWYSNNYGEIGNVCAWQDIRNEPLGSFSFTQEPLWSNTAGACVHS